jgi:hypothetical protein
MGGSKNEKLKELPKHEIEIHRQKLRLIKMLSRNPEMR